VTAKPDSSVAIAEAAAVWLARHDRGLTAQEQRDFAAWCAADPRHAEEWASLSDTWQRLDLAKGVPDLAAEAAQLEQRTRVAPRSASIVRWALPTTLAAAAALVLGFFLWPKATPGPVATPTVVLVAAEAKRLTLPDGSVVEARGESEVTFDFSGPSRQVRLGQGEAFFTVAHDPTRPFVVEAGGVAVRAVGTAFNVRRESGQVDVMVTEGRVRVANSPAVAIDTAPLVDAGTGARVSATARASALETRVLTPVELDGALAWRSPLLEFSRAPLDQVLESFRQHTPHRVRLGDPALGRRTISGTFQAENMEGFLRLAEKSLGLRVERAADGDIILHAAP